MIKKITTFILENWLIVAILILASWLRSAELDSKAIFFGDAGRDLLVASQAVELKELPLLGIPSSVPRFHQGPLTIWFEMIIFLAVGYHLYPFSLVFAIISIASVIGVYELMTVFSRKSQGQMAALLLAASPLAVAHGRMVYHITPIPLVMILYIWSLLRLSQDKPRAIFWAVFAWCVLFQFELAVVPLLGLIPYLIWKKGQRLDCTTLVESGIGLLLGLAPQILYDVTHGFAQLGGFGVWMIYRLLSAFSVVGEHAVGPSSISQTLTQFKLYGLRIVSVDQPWLGVVFGILFCWAALYSWTKWKQQALPKVMEISWLATIFLVVGFAIHSTPSEAYFPVLYVLLPILISYPLANLAARFQSVVWVGLGLWAILMVVSISRNGWFVGKTNGFAYGPSVKEQKQIVRISRQLGDDSFYFTTIQAGGEFISYFDNLRWLLREAGLNENRNGIPIFIEPKNSELKTYPTATRIESDTVDIYTYE